MDKTIKTSIFINDFQFNKEANKYGQNTVNFHIFAIKDFQEKNSPGNLPLYGLL